MIKYNGYFEIYVVIITGTKAYTIFCRFNFGTIINFILKIYGSLALKF